MIEREKVITEIEDALSGNLAKAGHVYKLSLNGLKDKALIDALALLKEQDERLRKLQKGKDKLCLEVSEWKHKYHDRPLKEQEAVVQCKDCRKGTMLDCHYVKCNLYKAIHAPMFYCADGVRRDGE